jgi:predicted branched-subunit amino acid permease
MSDSVTRHEKPYWSRAGARIGLGMAVPVLPGLFVYGLAVGSEAAHKGLSFFESVLMNLFIYAGAAQMLVLQIWPDTFTWGAVAGLALITAIVNARLLLMSASMQPWLGGLPAWQSYPSLYFLVDPTWLMSMRYRAEGGSDVGVYGGATAAFVFIWMGATTVGFLLGGLVTDPRRYGFDLVMPVFFVVLLFPMWGGYRRAVGWAIAGIVALAVDHYVPGWWFIVAGAVAGTVAGAVLDDGDAPAGVSAT